MTAYESDADALLALATYRLAADNFPVERTTPITKLMTEGIEHHLAGRFLKAVDRYSRVVAEVPDSGKAWRLLGVVALQAGDNEAAQTLLERAIRIDANDALARSALGSALEIGGNLDLAYAAYAAACAIDTTQTAALAGITRVALQLDRSAEAIAIGEAAVKRGTIDAGLLRTLGAAHLKVREYAGAAEALLASLQMTPHTDAYANLGVAYVHLKRARAAVVACDDALALDPSNATAANTLGIACKANGAYSAALAAFERAVELGSEEAHVNLGATRLLLGDYRRGWPEYGWISAERRANPALAALPMWDGTPSAGQRLLIWPEQGIGDTIQMARFVGRARALVGSVTLACPPGTLDLFRTLQGADALVDTREHPALGTFDLWFPTIRLPVVFDIAQESIPAAPYLSTDSARIEHFRPHLNAPGRLRVGVVWSGNPTHEWDDLRSCGLEELEVLHEITGITWFALQQDAARAQQTRSGLRLIPINAEVSDFADTAAIIGQLDLVITVDTSVAHLAGALGRPAWVLLPNRPDWRWQLIGDVSPWYPTLRLFRQGGDGSWAPVIVAIAAALRRLAVEPKRRIPKQ